DSPTNCQNKDGQNIDSLDNEIIENKDEENKEIEQNEINKKFEINTASIEELKTINRIGENIAREIIKNKPYCKYEELLEIKGIGQSILQNIIDDKNISLDSPTNCQNKDGQNIDSLDNEIIENKDEENKETGQNKDEENKKIEQNEINKKIEINTASIEELKTINRIGENIAREIIKNKPYCKYEELLEIKGIGQSILQNIIDDKNISLDSPTNCQNKDGQNIDSLDSEIIENKDEENKEEKNNQGNLKIVEINPVNDLLASYIKIQSIGGVYSGNLKVNGLGRGSSSREFEINVGSGEYIVISDTEFAFPRDLNVYTLDSIYISLNSQKLELIGQDGQIMDRVVSTNSNGYQSLYFDNNYEGEYRLFDYQDEFLLGEYELPKIINTSIKNIEKMDNIILQNKNKYERARNSRSKCVDDRELYKNKMNLHKNYSNIVNKKLKSDWYMVFEESGISSVNDIYQNQIDNLKEGKDLLEIDGIKVKPYNISHIEMINNGNISDLPSYYNKYIPNYYFNVFKNTNKYIFSLFNSEIKNFKNLFKKNAMNIERLFLIQEPVRGDTYDMINKLHF
ncbi:ComEA family DNA-binding protein, partial [Candidatus Vampirococcus lugosii]